jgi:hypothetical protein
MTEVAFGAILGLIVGVVAACVYLVFKPVLTVKEMPKEPVRGVVYFLPGVEGSAKSRNWQAKYKQFTAGTAGSIDLVEEELNAWAGTLAIPEVAAAPTPAPAKPGAKEEAKKPVGDGIFNPERPNFHIVDGKLQIGLKCVLNWYGLTTEVMVKATGNFTKTGDELVFIPDTIYLGSCPLHLLPALGTPFAAHLISREKIPDEVRAGWAKLSHVTLEGNTLKLVVQ